jgi:hypothetical protein
VNGLSVRISKSLAPDLPEPHGHEEVKSLYEVASHFPDNFMGSFVYPIGIQILSSSNDQVNTALRRQDCLISTPGLVTFSECHRRIYGALIFETADLSS